MPPLTTCIHIATCVGNCKLLAQYLHSIIFLKNCIFIRYDLYSKNAITDDLLHILHIYHNALKLGENISMSILEALGIFKAKIVEARNERRKKNIKFKSFFYLKNDLNFIFFFAFSSLCT